MRIELDTNTVTVEELQSVIDFLYLEKKRRENENRKWEENNKKVWGDNKQ